MYHDADRRSFDEAAPISTADVILFPAAPPAPADGHAQAKRPAPTTKGSRNTPKPGPSKRKADAPHRIPLNIGLLATDKMKILRVIARDNRLTAAQKAAAIPLVDFVNSTKGHSFFSWDGLGNECGLGWQAAKRAAEKLEQMGYVNIDHIEGDKVHVSLNLSMIGVDVPTAKRAMSRDKAREMYGQTPPTDHQEAPEDDSQRNVVPSQRQVVPGEMYGCTSGGMYGGTPGEVYGGTSGGMYGGTSKSETPLREVNQRKLIGEDENNVSAAAGATNATMRVPSDLEEELVIGFVPDHPLSWAAVPKEGRCRNWIPPAERAAAVEIIEAAWPGSKEPGKGRTNNDGLIARALMAGWTVDQLIDPMYLYAERMQELDSFGMLLVRYFAEEFDIFGDQAKFERDQKRALEPAHDDYEFG